MKPRFRRLSAPGASALSLWRLDAGIAELRALLGERLPPRGAPPRLVAMGSESQPFDHGLAWRRDAGEGAQAALELHLHGGAGVAAALRAWLAAAGWTEDRDPPDEDRARFLGAASPLAARMLGVAAGGAAARELARLERLAGRSSRAAAAGARAWLRHARWAEVLERPPRVVLAGPPNAGKSTLFNAWLRERRATVAAQPGTTRDEVEARVLVGSGAQAWAAVLVDTAGLWRAREEVDRAAVERTRALLAGAWRIVWVLDAATPPDEALAAALAEADAGDPRVLHRDDLEATWDPAQRGWGGSWLRGSALRHPRPLVDALQRRLEEDLGPPPPPATLLPFGTARRARLRTLAAAYNAGTP